MLACFSHGTPATHVQFTLTLGVANNGSNDPVALHWRFLCHPKSSSTRLMYLPCVAMSSHLELPASRMAGAATLPAPGLVPRHEPGPQRWGRRFVRESFEKASYVGAHPSLAGGHGPLTLLTVGLAG